MKEKKDDTLLLFMFITVITGIVNVILILWKEGYI